MMYLIWYLIHISGQNDKIKSKPGGSIISLHTGVLLFLPVVVCFVYFSRYVAILAPQSPLAVVLYGYSTVVDTTVPVCYVMHYYYLLRQSSQAVRTLFSN